MNIFIVGVQKCGTTTLASALGLIDNFELATPKEPMLFSRGDYESHRSLTLADTCSYQGMNDKDLLNEYLNCFHKETHYRIDASTSYFSSDLAISRIERLFPDARIIILIRHPLKRLNSAYWHYVRSGIALHKIDRELEFGPENLISFSSYIKWIKRWKIVFGQKVHVACAEDVWKDPSAYLNALSQFLDLDRVNIPTYVCEALTNHENSANVPIFLNLQLILNYLKQRSNMQFSHINRQSRSLLKNYGIVGLLLHSLTKSNLQKNKYPPIDKNLSYWLTIYLRNANANIDSIVDFGNPSLWWDDK